MSQFSTIIAKAEAFVTEYFTARRDERMVYHNLEHTRRVAAAAKQIADHYQLDDRNYFIVITAAWFHDIGYYIDPASHEQQGAAAAADFLRKEEVAEQLITEVQQCILATRLPQEPATLNEQIVCDADLFHLGTDSFTETNKTLRKEFQLLNGLKLSKDQWRANAIELLRKHHYHTAYAQTLLDAGKQRNLDRLLAKEQVTEDKQTAEPVTAKESVVIAEPEPKKDKTRPDKGIETMFRITSNNNQRLSDMADNKAHIMITVNSIILSAIISLLLRKLDDHNHLAIPTFMILAVSVTTIIFSILATRPSIPGGKFTRQDVEDKKVNLLFFGNFYKMSLDDYTQGMLKVMEDKDFLYGSLIKDVYAQGIVLGRKYKLLRASYNIFMFGLIISVIGFIIASYYSID